MLRHIAELHSIVGQNGRDLIRDCGDQSFEKAAAVLTLATSCKWTKANFEVRSNGLEQVQFAPLGADLGDIDMEIADKLSLERLLGRLVATGLGQPAEPIALQAAVQGRPSQARDRCLQREAVPTLRDQTRSLREFGNKRAGTNAGTLSVDRGDGKHNVKDLLFACRTEGLASRSRWPIFKFLDVLSAIKYMECCASKPVRISIWEICFD